MSGKYLVPIMTLHFSYVQFVLRMSKNNIITEIILIVYILPVLIFSQKLGLRLIPLSIS